MKVPVSLHLVYLVECRGYSTEVRHQLQNSIHRDDAPNVHPPIERIAAFRLTIQARADRRRHKLRTLA